MIVGQETNSWYGSYSDFKKRGIDKQMEIYSKFMKNIYPNMNNIFFRYVKDIIGNDKTIPVWTNLFKFDLGDDREERNISKAPKDEYNRIIEFHYDILSTEIEIIRPKIVIFFTGHTYDKLFFDPIVIRDGDYRKLYQKIKILDKIDEWKCCVLGLNNFNGFHNFEGKAIRTYHPMYLNRNLNNFGRRIVNYLKDEVSKVL